MMYCNPVLFTLCTKHGMLGMSMHIYGARRCIPVVHLPGLQIEDANSACKHITASATTAHAMVQLLGSLMHRFFMVRLLGCGIR